VKQIDAELGGLQVEALGAGAARTRRIGTAGLADEAAASQRAQAVAAVGEGEA
jgi:hypothetical protein